MKQLFLKFWPIFFIVALWFLFSSPYFLKAKVPYASTYQVNFFPPWSHYQEFWGPVKNNAMPDVHTQIYPWKKFTIETLKSGQIPFWNPYNFSGNPHLANFQSSVLSPFNVLFFILPFIDAWSILILLQPLLAGLFTYLLLREFKVSKSGSLISSISFMFSGFIVVWMAYGTLAYAILYLPLALFAIERYYSSKDLKPLLLLALTIPLSFFSGHFQISFYFLAATVAYIIFKGFTNKKLYPIPYTLYPILTVIVGLFLATLQLLPSIKLYLQSVRSEIFVVSEVIPWNYLITIIAPDFFGNPVTRNDWSGHYAEWASFIGVWPFLLAIYAIFQKPRKVLFFAFIGFASMILAIKSPLSSYLVSLKIPVLSTSAFSRMIVLFSFAFAILAGFGFDELRQDLKHKKAVRKIIFLLLLMVGAFSATWLLLFDGRVIPDEWLTVAKRNFVLPTLLFIGGMLTILVAIKNKKLMLFATPRSGASLLIFYFLFSISFDSLRFAQKWMPFDPRGLVYPQVPVIEAMKKNIGVGRVFGNIGAEVTTYYGLPSIEGYDPLYIGRYGEFIRSASRGEFLKGERSVVRLERRAKFTDRVLDLLGVTLIFHPIADTKAGWAYPVWEDNDRFSLIYEDDKFQLFRNNLTLPRAIPFYNYEVIKDSQAIIKRFYSEEFDFRRKLILEERIDVALKEGTGSAKIVSYTPNKIMVKVTTDQPALLFLSDNYYPGWKTYVNGKEERIYRADYSFRAVIIPAGNSEVEFIYEGWSF